MKHQANFVFGYGSLVNIDHLEQYLKRKLTPDLDYVICGLNNFQRCWNVAMDNRLDLPNYKYYRDPHTGIRFDGFVTFLNIRCHQNQHVLGILFRISHKELEYLDQRERNYQRINITHQLDLTISGNAWTYVGSQEAQQRYEAGFKQAKVVISQDYFTLVYDAYLSLGSRKLAHYNATTEKPQIPIVNLERCAI